MHTCLLSLWSRPQGRAPAPGRACLLTGAAVLVCMKARECIPRGRSADLVRAQPLVCMPAHVGTEQCGAHISSAVRARPSPPAQCFLFLPAVRAGPLQDNASSQAAAGGARGAQGCEAGSTARPPGFSFQ